VQCPPGTPGSLLLLVVMVVVVVVVVVGYAVYGSVDRSAGLGPSDRCLPSQIAYTHPHIQYIYTQASAASPALLTHAPGWVGYMRVQSQEGSKERE
jgi:hypothetical protein